MAGTTVIAAKLTLDGSQPVQSVRSFKQQLKEAQVDLLAMQETFGSLSPEAITAARNVAALRDTIQEAREVADLFDPGKKFQAFAGALSTVAAGYGAVQGAMGLIGVESEALEKQLLKVQSAMALAQGLSAIADGAKDFQRLGIVAKEALAGIRTGLLATGIGALVVTLGLIIAYWDKISEAVTGVSAAERNNLKVTQDIVDKEKDRLKHISDQDAILKLQGKSEREILQIKLLQIDATIEAQRVALEAIETVGKKQVESAVDTYSKVKTFFASTPLNGLADWLFDPADTIKKTNETTKAAKDGYTELLNQRAEFKLQVKEIDKNANKQTIETERAFRKELKLLRDAAANDEITDAETLAQKQLEQAYKAQRLDIKQSQYNRQQKAQLLSALDDKYQADTIKALDVHIREITGKIKEIANDAAKAKKDAQDKGLKDLQQGAKDNFDALKQINDLYSTMGLDEPGQQYAADKEALDKWHTEKLASVKGNAEGIAKIEEIYAEEMAKLEARRNNARLNSLKGTLDQAADLIGKQTVAGRALAIASTMIETYQSATSTYNSLSKIPIIGPALGFAGAAVALAAGIANAKKIGSIQIPGAGGGASSPSIPNGSMPAPLTPRPSVVNTSLPQDQINAMSNAAIRAYVIESDVTNSQEKITRLNRQARLGG